MLMLLFSRGCQERKVLLLQEMYYCCIAMEILFFFFFYSNTIHLTVFYSKFNMMLNNFRFFAVYGNFTYS